MRERKELERLLLLRDCGELAAAQSKFCQIITDVIHLLIDVVVESFLEFRVFMIANGQI